MRALGQPEVIGKAAFAAVATAVVCLPRLMNAHAQLRYPTWYLEGLILLGSMVLWGFVFAWYGLDARRPVFQVEVPARLWALATGLGLVCALLLKFFLDPMLRARSPQDFPADVKQWLGMALFNLGFTQLFLVFAPYAWALRLFKRRQPAVVMTVMFGVFVLVLKNRGAPTPLSWELLTGLLLFRVGGGLVSVLFFVRGGVLLVWWWSFLIQSRHLVQMAVS